MRYICKYNDKIKKIGFKTKEKKVVYPFFKFVYQ